MTEGKRPRRRIDFKDRIAALEAQVDRYRLLMQAAQAKKARLLAEHKSKAEAMLKEAGGE